MRQRRPAGPPAGSRCRGEPGTGHDAGRARGLRFCHDNPHFIECPEFLNFSTQLRDRSNASMRARNSVNKLLIDRSAQRRGGIGYRFFPCPMPHSKYEVFHLERKPLLISISHKPLSANGIFFFIE
jgi:hypothetical protein